MKHFASIKIKHYLLGFAFLLVLTLSVHFRTINVEVLELSTRAKEYVIAQIDFDFPNVEMMMIHKQEEVRDIGEIYRISPKQIRQRQQEFEASLINDLTWRQKLPGYTFDEITKSSIQLEKTLLNSRYTDQRTLQKIKELSVSDNYFYQLSPDQKRIVLPDLIWEEIENRHLLQGGALPETIQFALSFFKNKPWLFEGDLTEQIALRQKVEESIPIEYKRIEAGERIIDAGEIVTPRHIAMMSSMKSALLKSRNLWDPFTFLGSFILAAIFSLVGFIYLRYRHLEVLKSFSKMVFLVSLIAFSLCLFQGIEIFISHKEGNLLSSIRFPVILPLGILFISAFLGTEIALFAFIFLLISLSISLSIQYNYFLSVNFIASLIAIVYGKSIGKRRDIFSVCAKIWLSTVPVIIAFSFMNDQFWNFALLMDFLVTFVCSLGTAIIVLGLLPVFESLFDMTTDMTLVEYMDPNNELLKRLSLELPGTYQHSLVVGNIAEEAAQKIGANGLFCRVAALYHDIGKLSNPHYFMENQMGGFNIHQLLTPLESAQVIMAHVRDGEALARKYHLPESFIDVILQHHGTTLIYYFYQQQLQQVENVEEVNEAHFRYTGPKPQTKESAIIMIADAVEAASRSIEEFNEKTVTELVDKIVAFRVEDEQFDESNLTFKELYLVKESVIHTLTVARHLRVKYPGDK